ncbi:hypothetical protein AMECASPLE_029863 [Ameca splendens]|uniref:Uncharacterized protein n=1 Tax=Ameca splendens TaxID=208324 RepID=A0ABV0Y637_9TELE
MTERADKTDCGAQLRGAVSHQGILLGQHNTILQSPAQQQTQIQQAVTALTHQFQELIKKFPVSPLNPVPVQFLLPRPAPAPLQCGPLPGRLLLHLLNRPQSLGTKKNREDLGQASACIVERQVIFA